MDEAQKRYLFPLLGLSIDKVPSAGAHPFSRDFGRGVRRNKMGGAANHGGLDIPARVGTPYYAHMDGKVLSAGTGQGYGHFVDIRYADGTVHRIGHLGNLDKGGKQQPWPSGIRTGATVKAGQPVGYVGYSGNAGREFPHAHTEVFPNKQMYQASQGVSSRQGLQYRTDPRQYFTRVASSGGGFAPAGGAPQNNAISTRYSVYSPQKGGSKMEGGYAAARKGPDGQRVVRTMADVVSGKSNYFTVAGNPGMAGRSFRTTQPIQFYDRQGNLQTLPAGSVAYQNDTGGAFKGAAANRLDFAVDRDMNDAQMARNHGMWDKSGGIQLASYDGPIQPTFTKPQLKQMEDAVIPPAFPDTKVASAGGFAMPDRSQAPQSQFSSTMDSSPIQQASYRLPDAPAVPPSATQGLFNAATKAGNSGMFGPGPRQVAMNAPPARPPEPMPGQLNPGFKAPEIKPIEPLPMGNVKLPDTPEQYNARVNEMSAQAAGTRPLPQPQMSPQTGTRPAIAPPSQTGPAPGSFRAAQEAGPRPDPQMAPPPLPDYAKLQMPTSPPNSLNPNLNPAGPTRANVDPVGAINQMTQPNLPGQFSIPNPQVPSQMAAFPNPAPTPPVTTSGGGTMIAGTGAGGGPSTAAAPGSAGGFSMGKGLGSLAGMFASMGQADNQAAKANQQAMAQEQQKTAQLSAQMAQEEQQKVMAHAQRGQAIKSAQQQQELQRRMQEEQRRQKMGAFYIA